MQKAIDTFNSIGNFNYIFSNYAGKNVANTDENKDGGDEKEFVNSKTIIFVS